jgi:hypothetical protein
MMMEMTTMGMARKIERLQARKAGVAASNPQALLKNLQTVPKALESLDKVGAQLNETRDAIIQILREMDYQDFENRRQRAVNLRMQIDTELGKAPSAWREAEGERVRIPQDEYVAAMMIYEDQLRAEYDACVSLVRLFDWCKDLESKEL